MTTTGLPRPGATRQTQRMVDLLPAFAILAVFLGGGILLARKQARDYKSYLAQHTAETARQTEAQRALISQQVAAIDRQTEVLARIAEALERRA